MKKFSSTTKGHSPRNWKIKAAFATLAVVIALGWLAPVLLTSVSAVVTYPAHVVRVWIEDSNHSLALYLRDKDELSDRITELERERAQKSGTAQSITRLQRENETLRTLLNQDAPDRLAARVLARPNQLPYDVLQIDRGRADGVVVDAPVFYGTDQVIGFVFHVTRDYSLVSLVTTPNQTATAYVLGPDIYTSAEGVGNGMLRVRLPQGVSVEEGDVVILPAVSSGVYGEIVHIETTPTQPEQFGYVPLQAPLQSLRYVTVGRDPLTPADFDEAAARVDAVRDDLFQLSIPEEFQVGTSTATTSPVNGEEGSVEAPDSNDETL